MTDWSKTQHQDALRAEIARLSEALRTAERDRDEARTTNQRLNRRCGDYERALAEKRSLCSDGKPRGSNLSRALLNAYVTELRAENEALRPAFEKRTATGSLLVRAGDVLEGVEGKVTTRLRVTYVSEETLMARHLWSRGGFGDEHSDPSRESTWTLMCRDWRHVGEGERDTQNGDEP